MDSDTDSESVVDGDEDAAGSQSSSQSTELFAEEDEDEVMEVSDEEAPVPSLAGGANLSNTDQSRVTEVASNRSRIEPRLQSAVTTIGDPAGEDRSSQDDTNSDRSRTNLPRNSNLLNINSTHQGEIQNDRTTSIAPPQQRLSSTHLEPGTIRSDSARASDQTTSQPNPSNIPSENFTSDTNRENLQGQSETHAEALNPPSSSETNRSTTTAAAGEESRRDSMSDFKLPAKDAAKTAYDEDTDSDDESQTCIICYEPWSNSGKHRLASLKCGHLFGSSCIQKWLKGQGGKCPHCNAKAKKSDIRVIYAKALKAIDTSERDKALKELEREKELRRKTEIEKAQIMLKYQMAMDEVNRMRSQVKQQSSSSHSSQPGSSSTQRSSCSLSGNYALERTISVSTDGNSRILSYDYANHCLIASVPSPNQVLFAGFGVKKISALMNWKNHQYIPMHSKPIRGMAFNGRNDGLLLTGSMDKTLKITSLMSNTVVQCYNTTAPVWSCCWDSEDVNYLFAGLSNGQILIYDTRNTSEEVLTLNREGSKHPIVAMNYVPKSEGLRFPCSGILVGTLSNCSFWERTSPLEFKPHILPLEGNCISLSFEPSTRHCLASFRPNKTYPSMRHVMCELLSPSRAGQESEVKCNPLQSFFGGSTVKLLARSILFQRPESDDHLLVAAGDEGSSALDLWDSNSGSKVQHLMTGATVLDVCPFRFDNGDYLAALSEKVIKLYKWQP